MAEIEELRRNMSEKMTLQKEREKKKKKKGTNNSRSLVAVNIVGSTGPLKFVVNQDDLVAGVIDAALKAHARGGRLPVLGSDVQHFLLYCAHGGSDALNPWEPIGSCGERKFVLCKKQSQPQMTEGRSAMLSKKTSAWKAWLNKSFSFKISSHRDTFPGSNSVLL